MNEGLIARRYAKALLAYAEEHGIDEMLYREAKIIETSFLTHPELARMLLNPVVSISDKVQLLASAGGVEPSDGIRRFMKLLARNRREASIRTIFLVYQKLYRERHRIVRLKVITATVLGEALVRRIKELVQQKARTQVEFVYETDPGLIGGFVLQYGSMRMDASIANDLKQLRHDLVKK